MQLYVISILILVCGGVVCQCDHRSRLHWLGPLVSLAGAVCACTAAIRGLLGFPEPGLFLRWNLPFASLHLGFDSLTLFFAIPTTLVCGLTAVYSWGYLRPKTNHKGHNSYWFFYNLLFASMLTVLAARNGMLFLISWEIMSLSSFFLVIHYHEKKEVIKAGFSYLVATHVATVFLLVLFILLDTDGTMEFSGFLVTGSGTIAAFLLGLIGFGTKAGIIPLHTWLPEAHPAAPSPVSAVMSGVMIKMGIYGILRLITFTKVVPAWWGWVLLILGAVSAILGVLYAIAQHDLKKLLAYCSVENIGIILLGTGIGLLGISSGQPLVAVLGLSGAILHVFNHAVFKCLLFFGIGVVIRTTGMKNAEQMGGLIKRMPLTALTFLTAAIAISGLPPLNGFIGEFLIYLGAFSGIVSASGWIWNLVSIAVLALAGVLAAFCFSKVFGIAFLGEPRSPLCAKAHEASISMLIPMFILAILCLAIGLAAPLVFSFLLPVVSQFTPVAAVNAAAPYTALLLKISLVSAGVIVLALLAAGIRKGLLRKRNVQQAPTWDCGYHAVNPRMQYTAASFVYPLVRLFSTILGTKTTVKLQDELFPGRGSLGSTGSDLFTRYIYNPLYRSIRWISIRLYWLKKGNTHLFVLYIALVVIVLLVWKLR